MPDDRTIPTDIASTAKANLFDEPPPSNDAVRASSPAAPRAAGAWTIAFVTDVRQFSNNLVPERAESNFSLLDASRL